MSKFVDFAEVTIIKIFFRDLSDKGHKLRLIFREDGTEKTAFAILHHHPLLLLLRVRAYGQATFTIAGKRCES